ncbi:hypothetical protein PVAND_010381 [Polypedilum vanderplanki]|uniref:t-SNARE coiled-coil homology domain-containing protein n=1 Tax=Polypedilum vanderplanki TaxID=319348 RepID=A0A9J6CH33_POLVA|nr:hypothetical protein PVAND_010381 [Polypedilum vanderplanki]
MSNYDWDSHNRQAMLEGRQILERTTASLARSNQIAIDTENTGTEILTELDSQREALLRTSERLDNANDGLSASGFAYDLPSMKKNLQRPKIPSNNNWFITDMEKSKK